MDKAQIIHEVYHDLLKQPLGKTGNANFDVAMRTLFDSYNMLFYVRDSVGGEVWAIDYRVNGKDRSLLNWAKKRKIPYDEMTVEDFRVFLFEVEV